MQEAGRQRATSAYDIARAWSGRSSRRPERVTRAESEEIDLSQSRSRGSLGLGTIGREVRVQRSPVTRSLVLRCGAQLESLKPPDSRWRVRPLPHLDRIERLPIAFGSSETCTPLPNALRFCCRGVRRSRASQSRIYSRGCAAHTPRSAASAG